MIDDVMSPAELKAQREARLEELRKKKWGRDDLIERCDTAVELVELHYLIAGLQARNATLELRNRQLEERAWGESWVRDLAADHELNQIKLGRFLVRLLESGPPELIAKLQGADPKLGEADWVYIKRCQG